MHDLIIIGGGAAGLSAAHYALDKQLDVVAIAEAVGGKAGVQQHLAEQASHQEVAGAETVALLERRVLTHAGAILRDRVLSVDKLQGRFEVETQQHGTLAGRTVLIATGASPLPLDVPGARVLVNHGVGYSITTHAQHLSNKPVAVIGTTPRALRGVAELARHAAHIYLVAAEVADLRTPKGQVIRRLPNVTVLERYAVTEVIGAQSVEHMVVEQDGERSYIRVDVVFVDLGLLPNSGVVRRIVKTDAAGFIVVDQRNATSLPGLFAAGDVTTAFAEQILVAVGDGARAAANAYDYLLAQPTSNAEAAD